MRRGGAVLALAMLLGCSYALVRNGEIEPAPFDSLVRQTAAARGIAAPAEVDARVVSRDEIPALLRASIELHWTPEELANYQAAMVALGLWPADRDLVEEVLAQNREEIAGFYVPDEGTLYLVDAPERPFLLRLLSSMTRRDLYVEAVLSHEVVHLLQHRAYPELMARATETKSRDDLTAALQSAIEGDATRYGFAAMIPAGGALPTPDQLAAEIEAAGDASDDTPALLRLTLTFPYEAGYRLSYAEGAVLLDAPPASTEQVLHPEDRSAPFLAADLSGLVPSLPEGCQRLEENELGELGISVLLRDLAEAPDPASWIGWDGDRYLAARCGSQNAFLWWTSWDTPGDAREFATAYRGIAGAVRARADHASEPEVFVDDTTVVVVTPALRPLADTLEDTLRSERVATVAEVVAFAGLESIPLKQTAKIARPLR